MYMDEPNAAVGRATEENDELSLLDLLITLAENAKLLIVGPLLVGLLALGISFALPKTYESVMVLQADQTIASLMTTAAVLDPVAQSLGVAQDRSPESARLYLRERLKVAVGRTDKLITVTTSGNSPEMAQVFAKAVLDQIYAQARPRGTVKTRIEAQLTEAQGRLRDARNAAAAVAKRLDDTSPGSGERPGGYADLLNAAAAAQTQIVALQAQLDPVSEAQLLQAPTTPGKASSPRKGLITIGATLATGLALLVFVFLRQGWRTTAMDLDGAKKLGRLRQSFGLN
jgi:uncharacterized protein involved in exopolysaccharide biosynthesis